MLESIAATLAREIPQGSVANYIPELARVDANRFGMAVHTTGGALFEVGDSREPFSIQSIAKVLALALAMTREPGSLWKRVGVEPSGDPFNSLVQLEVEQGIPRNPFINAGALVVADVLVTQFDDPRAEFLTFARTLAGAEVNYDWMVAASEAATAFRNRALTEFMKSFGNIYNNVDRVLELYIAMCSLSMSCVDLARMFRFLAEPGDSVNVCGRILTRSQVKRINAIMLTCGFYDESGEFAFRVGLPGKSGVGGGIVAVHPGAYTVTVWSPRLNHKGNSHLGTIALEMLTSMTGHSIF